ncbi:sugar ABC transporter permease [Curtobacterium flaccumfaciens]|nr:sugar ABC transporter permease [Curtobacterium flaccumfaciens]
MGLPRTARRAVPALHRTAGRRRGRGEPQRLRRDRRPGLGRDPELREDLHRPVLLDRAPEHRVLHGPLRAARSGHRRGDRAAAEPQRPSGTDLPHAVLHPGRLLDRRDRHRLVLGPEPAARSSQRRARLVRHRRAGLAVRLPLGHVRHRHDERLGGLRRQHDDLPRWPAGRVPDLREAARLDGANAWQVFRYVVLPGIRRTTFLVSTLLIINAFQVFDQAYVLTKGGPGNSTVTIVYYIYDRGFGSLQMGYASALSFILFVIILAFSLVNARLTNRDTER